MGKDVGFVYCLKCGKDTKSERLFCAACLDSMEKYPVKPGTHITLPHREPVAAAKKNTRRHRTVAPEEQVRYQRKIIRRLSVLLSLVSILLILCTLALFTPIL